MVYYLYEIVNLVNGKTYCGQRKCPENLTPEIDTKYMGSGILIKPAIKKYGKENFLKVIIIQGEFPIDEINHLEQVLIKHRWMLGKAEYNLRNGGASYVASNLTKKKISNATSGTNNPMYGRHHTNEAKQKMSEGHIGRKCTEETRKKMSESRTGVKLSEEHRKAIAKGNTGKHPTEETKKKIGDKNRGRECSVETRQKIGNVHRGKKKSDETRKRMSEAAKKRPKRSPESIQKMIETQRRNRELRALLGIPKPKRKERSEETRKRMSEAQKGRKRSPESIAKQRGKKRSPEAIKQQRETYYRNRDLRIQMGLPKPKRKEITDETRKRMSESQKKRSKPSQETIQKRSETRRRNRELKAQAALQQTI
jgi:hypothetical protein